ncbi:MULTISPECIES: hypothetical protein [unclassified Streptomyces]|uniref:hypothetical protein n=1 Tax=unclassified Streptomyces TaxID=2593676 RepID=UPI0036697951
MAIIMLGAVVVGGAAAGVFWVLGQGAARALAAGGTAFLGAATLGLAIVTVLS